jgi:transposase
MNLHRNARLTPRGRRLLVERVCHERMALSVAAAAAGVSTRTASKWVGRYRREGLTGLEDRSSAPHRVPARTAEDRVVAIAALRRLPMTAAEISELLGMPLSTISAVLLRIGLGKRSRLEPLEPVNRYQRERPGELLHIDIKKLGRIDRIGHRITGTAASRHARNSWRPEKNRRIGWEYVHVCVDVDRPRFGGQLSAGPSSGLAERLSAHAEEAQVPQAVPAGVSARGGGALLPDRSHAR